MTAREELERFTWRAAIREVLADLIRPYLRRAAAELLRPPPPPGRCGGRARIRRHRARAIARAFGAAPTTTPERIPDAAR